MKFKIISTGNTIVADIDFVEAIYPNDYEQLPDDLPLPPVVPQTISMRQARLALYGAGLLDDVEAAVAQATKDVQIEWEFAAELSRNWPTLILLAGALGLTNAQVDGLFVQAASL